MCGGAGLGSLIPEAINLNTVSVGVDYSLHLNFFKNIPQLELFIFMPHVTWEKSNCRIVYVELSCLFGRCGYSGAQSYRT